MCVVIEEAGRVDISERGFHQSVCAWGERRGRFVGLKLMSAAQVVRPAFNRPGDDRNQSVENKET